jgi:hypothetical protein
MAQCHDDQLLQDEPVQSCSYSGTQSRGRSEGSGNHDDQENVQGHDYSPTTKAKLQHQSAKSEKTKSRLIWTMMRMMWPPSTDEEPSQKQARPAPKTTVITKPIEEVNNHQDSTGKEAQIMETMLTGTTSNAIFANSRDIDRRNAEKGSRRINPAMTLRAR